MVELADSSGITQRERSGKRQKVKSTGSFPHDPSPTGLSHLQTVCAKKMDFGWILFKY